MESSIENRDLRVFVAVMNRGSFTAAASHLKSDKAHVSRVIGRLEKRLGVQLLRRSTRKLSATETGAEFYRRAVEILRAIDEVEALVEDASGRLAGHLRVASGWELGTYYVNEWIAMYSAAHRGVTIEASYAKRAVDIIQDGVDVAIRAGNLPSSTLRARKLGDIEFGLYARPDYLASRSPITVLDDLADHDLVMFSLQGDPQWRLESSGRQVTIAGPAKIIVNSNVAARDIVRLQLGIALLPKNDADGFVDNGELRTVLPDWSGDRVPVHAVYASQKYLAPKVRAFIDLAADAFV